MAIIKVTGHMFCSMSFDLDSYDVSLMNDLWL